MNSSPVYIEISQGWLKALRDNDGIDVPLERSPNGQLTAASKEKLVLNLQTFLQRKSWQPRARAVCAISSSGVSLRRVELPSVAREEFSKLLRMQIEAQFPLSPDELAWGYRTLSHVPANGTVGKQELLVGAVKKDRVEEYASLLLAAGLNSVFTPAAIARGYLCPQPLGSCAVLDVGQTQSELALFESGVPTALRVFALSAESNGRTVAQFDALAKAIGGLPAGSKIYVTSSNGVPSDFMADLRSKIGNGCERLDTASGMGNSPAVLGLKQAEQGVAPPLLVFQAEAKPASMGKFRFSQPVPKKWAIRAAVLLFALLVLPYAEAFLLNGHLSKKLNAIKAEQGRLSAIDHDLDFLRYLKQNGPPYLDALYLFAKYAPQGARFESTSLNRRGEISLRGSMHDGQQVTDFRAKLIDTGFFERVTVEEQVPTPDHQKVNVRISAQWKPIDKRTGLAIGPTPEEIQKAKTNATAKAGSPGRGGMPPGFPAGLPPGIVIQ